MEQIKQQKQKILIVDEDIFLYKMIKNSLDSEYDIYYAKNIVDYNRIIKIIEPFIVIVDDGLNDDSKANSLNGIQGKQSIQDNIRQLYKNTYIVVISENINLKNIISDIKNGVFDYIIKPIKIDKVNQIINDISLHVKNTSKISVYDVQTEKVDIIGNSSYMAKIYEQVKKVKDINVNVLITGESGVGKDLIAQAIHYDGIRGKEPYIVVNCAAIPENLIESELFGYEKGAFTGADKSKKGAFELADKGTIFLDEIGEMALHCQAKVLRALQNKEITPVGSGIAKNIDVRVIAATNKNLYDEVQNGSFRMDLYYRLNIFPIYIPALRERKNDIPNLVNYFINKANSMYHTKIKYITNEAMQMILNLSFQGNVRELENIIYRACIMAEENFIDKDCLNICEGESERNTSLDTSDVISFKLGCGLDEIEKQAILSTLDFVGGNKSRAAKILGISERSVHYKLKTYLEN